MSCSRSTPAFADDVAQGRPGTVRLAYDRSRDRARASIAEAEALLRAFNREWGRGRLMLRGVAPEVANPLNVESRDLATPQSSGALVLFLIAFYGLFAAVMGGMAAALDTTAGERERASLEPLLTTPVAPLELATGKWLAVSLLNATAVVLTLSGFYLTLRFAPLPAVGIPFLFGLAELGRFVVALVPLILLMPAILLYVGCRGRTFKEAQSNLSVLLFAVSLLPIVQMFLQKQGAGMADLGSGVRAVRAAVACAARRSAALGRAAAVLRGAGTPDARGAAGRGAALLARVGAGGKIGSSPVICVQPTVRRGGCRRAGRLCRRRGGVRLARAACDRLGRSTRAAPTRLAALEARARRRPHANAHHSGGTIGSPGPNVERS